jgi:hypothetical protein
MKVEHSDRKIALLEAELRAISKEKEHEREERIEASARCIASETSLAETRAQLIVSTDECKRLEDKIRVLVSELASKDSKLSFLEQQSASFDQDRVCFLHINILHLTTIIEETKGVFGYFIY